MPTVRIGDAVLVNPPPRRLIEQIREFDPNLIRTTSEAANTADRWRVAQWIVLSTLIAFSVIVAAEGYSALSWGIDIIAIVIYVATRSLRLRVASRRLGNPPAK